MHLETPRLVIAGLAGDSGKTLVAIGLARAMTARGHRVGPLKKGPDYIDAAWLGAAAGRPGRNLDTFLMDDGGLGEVLRRSSASADLLLVEGNRGLHDGFDAAGSHSTAVLAKRLAAPVILVLDVTKMTRTAAALVNGCASLDPQLRIAGVVLNQVATRRQEKVIREAMATHSTVPVLGVLPRLGGDTPLPGRHLGLVTASEHPHREAAIARAEQAVTEGLDLAGLEEIARSAPPVTFDAFAPRKRGEALRIGVFRDAAFSFYYQENLESLEEAGAELIFVSPLRGERLPECDGLYLGGGFPEVYAEELSRHRGLMRQLAQAAGGGLPIYAECGGLIYLSARIETGEGIWPMSGVLDLVVEQRSKPQGHGYVRARVSMNNPFFADDVELRGHEFHYTRVREGADADRSVLALERGEGIAKQRDGIVAGALWASYLHLHAMGVPNWADGFLDCARAYRARRGGERLAWG